MSALIRLFGVVAFVCVVAGCSSSRPWMLWEESGFIRDHGWESQQLWRVIDGYDSRPACERARDTEIARAQYPQYASTDPNWFEKNNPDRIGRIARELGGQEVTYPPYTVPTRGVVAGYRTSYQKAVHLSCVPSGVQPSYIPTRR